MSGNSTHTKSQLLDTFRSGDVDFYRELRLPAGGAAEEVEHYATVDAAASSASAVVVGTVTGVHRTRVIHGEGNDRLFMIGVDITPDEVLAGRLPGAFRHRLTVEFVSGSQDPRDTIDRMANALPTGRSVWFLRAKADESARALAALKKAGRTPTAAERQVMDDDRRFYRLVSSQGLYVQGEDHVLDPVAAPDDSGVVRRAEAYRRLSELVDAIRQ